VGGPLPCTRTYPSTNNICINQTLLEAHDIYLHNTIIPVLSNLHGNVSLPEFLPLSEENRLKPLNTPFVRSYTGLERRPKGWAGGLVSVANESTSEELEIERELLRLYKLHNYKSKHYKLTFQILHFKSMIPNRHYKSVDDNS